ncbi:polysaccharide deacetylase family protein [Plectonema radiosum NIES-515]|uniref:Polysaccharide deacetylase family protein n=1 Tax=Plectonema radiosum NIES-515 TaxID=2986073 RepID=A0ABT3AX32_9CYAN|nr:polysaccharide deacetylase family protein [Plectonema radiosum]MCV3213683.1 polysaccharide deacetylase family protein [Plectonema radiosum NIES-515]
MTNNHSKRQKIFGVVAIAYISALPIAFFVTACSIAPTKKEQLTTSKLHAAQTQQSQDTQSPAKLENSHNSVPAKYQGKTVYKGQPSNNEKVIALTIDDGPWQNTTAQMLDILKKNNVKVTFFWVGQALQEHPDLAKQEVAQGHAIGNHTWHHWYKRMDEATAKSEIERTADLMYKTTGVKTSLFRPPGGVLNNGLATYAKSQKYAVVMWSQTSADTDPHAKYQVFVKNVLRDAKPGGIVLMHDGGGDRQRTVQALPQIISGLKQQGYRFVTVPQLLKESGG